MERLHIDVTITDKHYYKMSEYKPTLAVLFSELLINPKTSLEYEWYHILHDYNYNYHYHQVGICRS